MKKLEKLAQIEIINESIEMLNHRMKENIYNRKQQIISHTNIMKDFDDTAESYEKDYERLTQQLNELTKGEAK